MKIHKQIYARITLNSQKGIIFDYFDHCSATNESRSNMASNVDPKLPKISLLYTQRFNKFQRILTRSANKGPIKNMKRKKESQKVSRQT